MRSIKEIRRLYGSRPPKQRGEHNRVRELRARHSTPEEPLENVPEEKSLQYKASRGYPDDFHKIRYDNTAVGDTVIARDFIFIFGPPNENGVRRNIGALAKPGDRLKIIAIDEDQMHLTVRNKAGDTREVMPIEVRHAKRKPPFSSGGVEL